MYDRVFVRFGNHRIDEGADLHVYIPADQPSERTVEQEYRPRVGRGPMAEQRSYPQREIAFEAAQSTNMRDAEVARILDVTAGEQELEIVDLETQTSYIAKASVTRLMRQSPGFGVWEGTFTVREPAQALTATTTTGAELDVYGNTFALPTITFQPNGGNVRWRRLTATDNTGRGLANHPIRFEFDSSGVGADQPTNFICFYGPRPVPFQVIDAGTENTALWLRMDLPASGEAHVTVFYGSDVDNPDTANEYLSGGMDLVNSTNTQWAWNDWSVREFPNANGVWQPGVFAPIHSHSDISLQSAVGAEITSLQDRSPEIVGDKANALILMTGVRTNDDNALKDLSRTVERLDGEGTVDFQVRYQPFGTTNWSLAWNQPRNSDGLVNFDTDISIPGATAVLATIQGNDTNDARMLIGAGDTSDVTEGPSGSANTFETPAIEGFDWSNPSNVTTEADYASVSLAPEDVSRYLGMTDFGFNVPSNAIITGIEVVLHLSTSVSSGTRMQVRSFRLYTDGQVVGDDKGAQLWDNDLHTRSRGGPADMWGATWTPAMINDSGFGVAVAARRLGDSGTVGARVHYAEITVYYIEGGDQPTIELDTEEAPTTTVSSINNARILDGEFTVTHPDNSETIIGFDQVYMSDTDLTVDCDDMRLTVGNDTWFTAGRGVTFIDRFRWCALDPGKHTVSTDLSVSWSLSWHDRLDL